VVDFQRPVTAAQIRARPEWQATYPDAEVVYEQDADEGQGSGFDNLNMNASAWTYYHAPAATWEQVVDAYASRLTTLGWRRTDAGGPYWTHQVWTSPARPGESIAVSHRPPTWERWRDRTREGTVFSLFHSVNPASAGGASDA
jgi:hypothetical protein